MRKEKKGTQNSIVNVKLTARPIAQGQLMTRMAIAYVKASTDDDVTDS